jgi:hypothetical protein
LGQRALIGNLFSAYADEYYQSNRSFELLAKQLTCQTALLYIKTTKLFGYKTLKDKISTNPQCNWKSHLHFLRQLVKQFHTATTINPKQSLILGELSG